MKKHYKKHYKDLMQHIWKINFILMEFNGEFRVLQWSFSSLWNSNNWDSVPFHKKNIINIPFPQHNMFQGYKKRFTICMVYKLLLKYTKNDAKLEAIFEPCLH